VQIQVRNVFLVQCNKKNNERVFWQKGENPFLNEIDDFNYENLSFLMQSRWSDGEK